ncbi:MAG: Rrf2 family transcriptional regulator [Pirellulales bacterium]|nr:Rrf2 family transcriptional regulator [Pirellulales bacterium]
MRISAKTEYACIAMLELAAAYGTDLPVQIRRIADRHAIPSRFLVQILLQLKGAGFVTSTRGAAGGYQLAKPPDEISLAEVMQVIEGTADSEPTSSASPESRAAQVLMDVWREAADVQQQLLAGVTFADLLDRARAKGENMYYI